MSNYSHCMFIGSERTRPSGPSIPVVNPATEEVLDEVASATEADIDRAVTAAREAQRSWAELPPVQRGNYLRSIAALLNQNKEELATLVVHEVGKPLAQAREEVENAAANCAYTAEWDRRIEGEIVPSDNRGEQIQILRVPFGVVAAITPWNYPIELFFRKVAPALLTGNTVVLKPSEVTPLSSIRIMQLLADNIDLPSGVLNLITGGKQTGAALISHPGVNLITMTGHRDSGKAIMRAAAANLTRVSLELGGSAPAIVLEDADIGAAVQALIVSRHANSGQVCTCAERIYVQQSVLSSFTDQYVAAVQRLQLGDPMQEVDLGPLVNEVQYKKVDEVVAIARKAGGKILTGGGRPDGAAYKRGYWFAPTVVANVDSSSSLFEEETFGPVTPIMPFETLDQAISLANKTRYGLSAYVFSNDYRRIMETVNSIDFGEVYVNRPMGEALQAHHIGHKESGIGGEDGKHGVLKYTQLKSVYHRFH